MATFATLTVEQFMHRFFIEESPYWRIYNAHRSKELMTKYRPDADGTIAEVEVLDYSWMQLQMFFENSPGGVGKIILKKNENDNNMNSPTYYVKWGASAGASLPGIGNAMGAGVSAETQQMLQMQREMYEGRISDLKDIMKLRHELEQREAEIEGLLQPGIQEQLISGGIDLLKTMVGRPMAAPAQLGTIGEGEPPRETPPPTDNQARPLSMDQAFNDLVALKQLVPGIHPNDALRAVVLFAQQDPGQATTYLNMLIKQVNG
ncbi:hypothetical protein [Lewinella sp. W8]|uniref:hypothetical protein n=1 Tax=Lewinella sp. W8 TaxID=2528208 RepID=UPI00106885DE|nr:hypothetical protein [Lewinella sp. W8]MTB53895.1 hypothetical protein [Lewinella sp. W8]